MLHSSSNYLKHFCNKGFSLDCKEFHIDNDLFPSLGATINQTIKHRKHIISQNDPRYRLWEMFLILLVLYSAWICPFEFAFLRYLPSEIFLMDNIVNSIFAIDITLTFFVAYIDHKSYLLVDDPKRIAVRYLSTWFIFDACSTFPFHTISLFFNKHGNSLGLQLLSMLRLWRLHRVSSMFARSIASPISCPFCSQRDTIQAASEFVSRNKLPKHIEEQMLSHICLKFKTEELKQQKILDCLPKAIKSSIAEHLFLPIVQNVYIFQGVSLNLICQLVSTMQAEYFAPNEDVILQKEKPTDLYIIVSGSVEMITYSEGTEQVHGKATAGGVFGEIGVLCKVPQPFTIKTIELSQILRLDRTALFDTIQESKEDATIIMQNLYQKLKLHDKVYLGAHQNDTEDFQREQLDRDNMNRIMSYASDGRNFQIEKLHSLEQMETGYPLCKTESNKDICAVEELSICQGNLVGHADHQNRFHIAPLERGNETAKILPKQGATTDKDDGSTWMDKRFNRKHEKGTFELLSSDIDRMNFTENDEQTYVEVKPSHENNYKNHGRREWNTWHGYSDTNGMLINCCSKSVSHYCPNNIRKLTRKVIIHMHPQEANPAGQQKGKMINLPDTIEELRKIRGEKFVGYRPAQVINQENAEIDDISIIRDGDHVYLIEAQ